MKYRAVLTDQKKIWKPMRTHFHKTKDVCMEKANIMRIKYERESGRLQITIEEYEE